jgi:hypothetical protein
MKYQIEQLRDASKFSSLKGEKIMAGIGSRKLKLVDLLKSETYSQALVIWTKGDAACEVITGPAMDQRIHQGW